MLGCIADDVTGATDLATNLVHGGMSVIQWLAIPTPEELSVHAAEGIIIALKSRSIEPAEAVAQSLRALAALQAAGCQRFFFKYCSTFDSTSRGNIGPVASALCQQLRLSQTIYCPAFPRNDRTVCRGYLFVGDVLLNESGMEQHPLNPMTDASLIRTLQPQVTAKVGLLNYVTIDAGPAAIAERLESLRLEGVQHVIVDCLNERHLETLALALADLPLITGGSGIGRYLPERYRQLKLLPTTPAAPFQVDTSGRQAILSGSCSAATQRQVAAARDACVCYPINIAAVVQSVGAEVERFRQWLTANEGTRPILVYSTAAAGEVAQQQARFGRGGAAEALEAFQASVARLLVAEAQVRVMIVAGGETSGAVVQGLGIRGLEIGPEICPGVPWTRTLGQPSLTMALKSGNFGTDDFFLRALDPRQTASV